MADFAPTALFFAVTFTVIPSDALDDRGTQQVVEQLEGQGATFLPLTAEGRINDVLQHTHIISEHIDFPDYNTAVDANCYVVKPSWVSQSIEKKRQAQTRQHSPDPSFFFSNVVLTCADLPSGDKDAITAGVLALGGMYSSPLTKLVTHVVTVSSNHEKVTLVREKNLKAKVVLPHWFDDCLKLGKKIDEGPYLLPNPEILRPDAGTLILPRKEPDIGGATSAVAGRAPRLTPPMSSLPSPSTPRKNLNAFVGRTFFFSRDLNINKGLAKTLEQLVERGGGHMTQSVGECDVYIGHFRDGLDYVTASRTGKTVANLAWFYNVVTRNRWTNPLTKLLHYPVPKKGIPGFEGMKISVSNYTGEARAYLENLVKEAGGEFTRTMKQDNTHLITAHKHSEKCDAAQEWNINIVNHLWLEESYARCAVQSLTNLRYTHFPSRTNLGEIVGQTQIDILRVEQLFFNSRDATARVDELPPRASNIAHGQAAHILHEEPRPRPSPRKTVPASSAVPARTLTRTEDAGLLPPMSDIAEAEDVSTPQPEVAKKRRKLGSDVAIRTPSGLRASDGKENESPPTTGGRSSKQRAMERLHESKDDIALFQKEMKRRGGVVHGGRRDGSAEPASARKAGGKAKKRTSNEAEMDDFDTEQDAADGDQDGELQRRPVGRPAKKTKPATVAPPEQPPLVYKMMVSGDERWLGNMKKEVEDKRILRSLGIQLTQTPTECTLLCAPRLLRTRKFIAAIACAPTVVTTDYLDYALTHQSLREPTDFPLLDDDAEARFGLRLDESMRRAKENDRKLLRGWTIYITDKVNGGFDTYHEIVSVNGGLAVPYRGRTGVQLPNRRLRLDEDPDAGLESQNQGGDAETDYVYLVSGADEEETKIWPTFRKMAEKQDLVSRIVKTDWLLSLAMCQKVEWHDWWEHEGSVGA